MLMATSLQESEKVILLSRTWHWTGQCKMGNFWFLL